MLTLNCIKFKQKKPLNANSHGWFKSKKFKATTDFYLSVLNLEKLPVKNRAVAKTSIFAVFMQQICVRRTCVMQFFL